MEFSNVNICNGCAICFLDELSSTKSSIYLMMPLKFTIMLNVLTITFSSERETHLFHSYNKCNNHRILPKKNTKIYIEYSIQRIKMSGIKNKKEQIACASIQQMSINNFIHLNTYNDCKMLPMQVLRTENILCYKLQRVRIVWQIECA